MSNKIVSRGLYIEGLRKIKIPAFIFAAIMILTQVISPMLVAAVNDYRGMAVDAHTVMAPLAVVPVVMTPILTLVAFFAFNKRSSSDYYQSLPYTRTCLFFSWILSVLTVAVGLIVSGTILGYLSRLLFPRAYILTFGGMGMICLWYLAVMLFGMACVLVAMSVTGTFISNVVGALLLMFLPRMILVIIRELILGMTPVLNSQYFLGWMSFEFNALLSCALYGLFGLFGTPEMIMYSIGFTGVMESVGPSLFTLFIALIYIALAAVLFKHRKSETATLSGANRPVQHIIRIALTLAISLLGTWILVEEQSEIMGIVIYCIALIVFLAYEIITTKKWINLVKALPTLLIIVALNAGVWGVAHLCSHNIIYSTLEAEDINAVRIIETNTYSYLTRRSNDIWVSDPDACSIVAQALQTDLDALKRSKEKYNEAGEYWDSIGNEGQVFYKESKIIEIQAGGQRMYRSIRFSDSQLNILAERLAATEEYKEAYMDIPEAVTDTMRLGFGARSGRYGVDIFGDHGFESSGAKELFEVLKNEVLERGFENWYANLRNGSDANPECIFMTYTTSERGHEEIEIPLTRTYTPDAYAKALSMICQAQSGELVELYDLVDILLQNREKPEASPGNEWIDSYYLHVSIMVDDEKGEMQYNTLDISGGYADSKDEDKLDLIRDTVAMSVSALPGRTIAVYYSYSKMVDDNYEYHDGTVLLPVPQNYMDYID